jgi:hypothetical protein
MPFESSKPGPRDPDGLAPELESLADQLSRDAQWLASRFPAHKPSLPLKGPRRLRWVAFGAAAALVLLAVDAWWMWERPQAPAPAADLAKAASPAASSVAGARSETASPRRLPLETRLPGISFKDLNGAEKEAVLDLLEERAPALTKTSLSL